MAQNCQPLRDYNEGMEVKTAMRDHHILNKKDVS